MRIDNRRAILCLYFALSPVSLMTLPGGVLLVLSAEWSQAETNAFFSDNGIKMDSVSELSYIANGFFIETEPGFPSLDLANDLSALAGVAVSSPNWGRKQPRSDRYSVNVPRPLYLFVPMSTNHAAESVIP